MKHRDPCNPPSNPMISLCMVNIKKNSPSSLKASGEPVFVTDLFCHLWIIFEDHGELYVWVSEVQCSPQWPGVRGARRAKVTRSPLASSEARFTKARRAIPSTSQRPLRHQLKPGLHIVLVNILAMASSKSCLLNYSAMPYLMCLFKYLPNTYSLSSNILEAKFTMMNTFQPLHLR